ncbi:MAG: DUF262 and DUF1524 domain-containing protein [Candidatus Berkelbacteria bacterium]
MKAVETSLTKFLQGTKQFIIPIYQRTYSWTTKQCDELWSDILRAVKSEETGGHFIGSIVYIENGLYQVAAVSKLLVIDGQQRLTTLSLLMMAIRDSIADQDETSDMSKRKINNYYLINSEEEGDLKYRLMLTKSDREAFINLLEGRSAVENQSGRINENYNFFINKIKELNIDVEELYKGISKLIIVDIALDRDRDNPQLIFESLNSTGLDLSQADLIRNYVLMGLEQDDQVEVYEKSWYPMEQSFGHAEYSVLFDRFMRDYLTIKTGRIPNINQIYENFKVYASSCKLTISEIVADVYHHSKRFVELAFERVNDTEIRGTIKDINTLKVDVAYPFLMVVLEDYDQNRIIKEELIEILRLVESYVFRRGVCGIPTNSMNKTFGNLAKFIDRDNYLESVKAVLLAKDSYRRFPNDEEFMSELLIKDVYNFSRRNYLLDKLENFGRKEKVSVDTFTIEHIMPQNPKLSSEWQANLGDNWKEIQEKYLHTIGNLTLTGYNPELSDKAFADKQSMEGGFKDSPIRLNYSLANLPSWNEEEITKRGKELAVKAVKIWIAPSLPSEIIQKYKQVDTDETEQIYTLDIYKEYLQGNILDLFNKLRQRILNIDSSVKEVIKAKYIAYKNSTNFVDIIPQKNQLKVCMNMDYNEIIDPEKMSYDVTGLGHWGNGNVEAKINSETQIDYLMTLIEQSFQKNRESDEISEE